MARCSQCGAFSLPIDIVCDHCHTNEPNYSFEPVSGRGTVRSWTVIRQSFLPGFEDVLPFVLVDVELDEQADLRMVARLLDDTGAPSRVGLRIGMRVAVAFEDLAPGKSVPAFVLDES
ncbi:MAG: hypothetical protein EXQ79_05450 [Acidimicrobiia bacterium]|nr:hypothetical protein [Acidimicrobiia bacterium]